MATNAHSAMPVRDFQKLEFSCVSCDVMVRTFALGENAQATQWACAFVAFQSIVPT
jgi:hypothetical protein